MPRRKREVLWYRKINRGACLQDEEGGQEVEHNKQREGNSKCPKTGRSVMGPRNERRNQGNLSSWETLKVAQSSSALRNMLWRMLSLRTVVFSFVNMENDTNH